MNRSIFQIRHKKLGGITLTTFLIIILLLLFIIFNKNVNCVDFKCSREITKYMLQEISYNNIKYYKAYCINEQDSKLALKLFLDYKKNQILDYKISKYFLNKNGVLIPFDKKSPYSHPNLFLGCFNNISFNYQFSHQNWQNKFTNFSDNDMIESGFNQYLCNNLYMYNSNLSQLMLNFNDVFYNEQYKSLNNDLLYEINKNNLKVQNYLENNKNNFNKFINNSLND